MRTRKEQLALECAVKCIPSARIPLFFGRVDEIDQVIHLAHRDHGDCAVRLAGKNPPVNGQHAGHPVGKADVIRTPLGDDLRIRRPHLGQRRPFVHPDGNVAAE